MSRIHGWLGVGLVLAFLVLALWGVALRVAGRDEAPTLFRAVQHWTENLLALQTVIGLGLLLVGRRVVGTDLVFLHYFYGSLFPLIAVVGGRIASLRREERAYVGMAWGAFFAFGLTARAWQLGCGGAITLQCLTG